MMAHEKLTRFRISKLMDHFWGSQILNTISLGSSWSVHLTCWLVCQPEPDFECDRRLESSAFLHDKFVSIAA